MVLIERRKRAGQGLLWLLMVLAGAAMTATVVEAGRFNEFVVQLGLGLLLGLSGFSLGRRYTVRRLVGPLTLIAAFATILVFLTPLGVVEYGARRHLHIGLVLQPAPLLLLATQFALVAAADGWRPAKGWLTVALLCAAVAAAAMPELSLVPQLAASATVVAWPSDRRRLALIPVVLLVLLLLLSTLIPYVQRRWVGWLEPELHALGAGFDYRALARTTEHSVWWGPGSSERPLKLFSPADDYWFAAVMARLGRVPVFLWVLGLIASLRNALKPRSQPGSSDHALLATVAAAMSASLVVHVGYNMGMWPITAVPMPLTGTMGTAIGVQLFGLCFALGGALRAG